MGNRYSATNGKQYTEKCGTGIVRQLGHSAFTNASTGETHQLEMGTILTMPGNQNSEKGYLHSEKCRLYQQEVPAIIGKGIVRNGNSVNLVSMVLPGSGQGYNP
ncbi:hypothetical protein DPMN_185029 [Dreissena polymorpha]|uniref:Uncharacterized protein n=1 Tax=Dreissena polymorpha TaxID=45954 RepID=A0A9D4I7Y3_DREPO|nr:hypothetical protein DPMN_185029 [Dreissena polymorpha]